MAEMGPSEAPLNDSGRKPSLPPAPADDGYQLADEDGAPSLTVTVLTKNDIDAFLAKIVGRTVGAIWRDRAAVHELDSSDSRIEQNSSRRIGTFIAVLNGRVDGLPRTTPEQALELLREVVQLIPRIDRKTLSVDPLRDLPSRLALSEQAAEHFEQARAKLRAAFSSNSQIIMRTFASDVLGQISPGLPDNTIATAVHNAVTVSMLTVCDSAGVAWPDGYRGDQASYGEDFGKRSAPSPTVRERARLTGSSPAAPNAEDLRRRRDMTPGELQAERDRAREEKRARLKPGSTNGDGGGESTDFAASTEAEEIRSASDQVELSAEQSARVEVARDHKRLKESVKSRVTAELRSAYALSPMIALPEGDQLARFQSSLMAKVAGTPTSQRELLNYWKADLVHAAVNSMAEWIRAEVSILRLEGHALDAKYIDVTSGDGVSPPPVAVRRDQVRKAYREQTLLIDGGADLLREASVALARYLNDHRTELQGKGLLTDADKRTLDQLTGSRIRHSS